MDSSGSSSSMAMSNNREAPSSSAALAATAEDEVALSVASGLAKEAALLFQSGKFKDCIRVLNQLLLNKEGDPKVNGFLSLCIYLNSTFFWLLLMPY